jgi:asparaginyl-tRNA synthetase
MEIEKVVSEVDNFLSHIENVEFSAIFRIQTILYQELQNFMISQGFYQLMPLMISPFTDPLNHQVYPAELNYEGKVLKITSSMIFFKQLSLIQKNVDKVFIFSPNIRLELPLKAVTGNHALEFSQFDFEIKNASMCDVMDFIEDLYIYIFKQITDRCKNELKILNRSLPLLTKPFPRYSLVGKSSEEADRYCSDLSKNLLIPFFVTSLSREFYDREDPLVKGTYRNYDLFYPEGFEEALSGGEREYIYKDILRRMNEKETNKEIFQGYLAIAERELLPKSAGAGIGFERLLKFISGKKTLREVCLFDRTVGSDLVF